MAYIKRTFREPISSLTSKENVIGMTIDRFRDINVTQGNVEGFAILTVDSRWLFMINHTTTWLTRLERTHTSPRSPTKSSGQDFGLRNLWPWSSCIFFNFHAPPGSSCIFHRRYQWNDIYGHLAPRDEDYYSFRMVTKLPTTPQTRFLRILWLDGLAQKHF